jgi:hypothetical protein
MKIEQLWPTPVGRMDIFLPDEMRRQLVEVLIRKDAEREKIAEHSPDFHRFMMSKQFFTGTHYNLFAEADELPERDAVIAFEKIACEAFRRYLREAYDIGDADRVRLAGRCFGNVQLTGARTFPHYHQSCDGVLIHYLDVGDGRDPDANLSPRHGTHALLLLDPRGSPNYPWWEKVHSIAPHRGLTLIHPAYLWHETNVWRGAGTRVCIVVNFQVVRPGYLELHREMRF